MIFYWFHRNPSIGSGEGRDIRHPDKHTYGRDTFNISFLLKYGHQAKRYITVLTFAKLSKCLDVFSCSCIYCNYSMDTVLYLLS
jgi:hypothetical protein